MHYLINDPVWCWYRRLSCYIILYHLLWPPPNTSTWEYMIHIKCCLCCQFPWHCVKSVCQRVDGQRNCRQKHRMGSSLIVFACQVCTLLFGASDWRLRCGPVTSTRIILFQMPPLLMMWCYTIVCKNKWDKNNLFIIYNSLSIQGSVVYFYSKDSQKWQKKHFFLQIIFTLPAMPPPTIILPIPHSKVVWLWN